MFNFEHKPSRKERRAGRPQRRPFRPTLEALEERITPDGTNTTVLATTVEGPSGLRADIAAFNAPAVTGNDVYTINLNLTAGSNAITTAANPLTVTNANTDLSGTPTLVINGAGAGPGGNVISGGFISQVFAVSPHVNLILKNLTIIDGKTTGAVGDVTPDGEASGGGLVNASGNVTMSNVKFTSNQAAPTGAGLAEGGAIFTVGGTLTLDNVTLNQNSATAAKGGTLNNAVGGALSAYKSNVIVTNVPVAPGGTGTPLSSSSFSALALTSPLLTVTNNTAQGGTSATVTSGAAGNNYALGGGLFVEGGTASIFAASVTGNNAIGGNAAAGKFFGGNASGGGVSFSSGAQMTVVASTFSGNTARSGNGGTNIGGTAGSAGQARGGGIADTNNNPPSAGGFLTLLNSTVDGNFAIGGRGRKRRRGRHRRQLRKCLWRRRGCGVHDLHRHRPCSGGLAEPWYDRHAHQRHHRRQHPQYRLARNRDHKWTAWVRLRRRPLH